MTMTSGKSKPSDVLREASEPDWTAAVTHRFVHELAAGTLDRAVMRRYLVQDYQFLDAFVALLGAAIHAAPSLPQRIPLGRFLGMVVSEENTYFQRSFDALDVPEAERVAPALAAPTAGFQALMREAAASGRYGAALAVLTVAEWVYLSWAAPLAGRDPGWFVFREWIDLHSGPSFEAWVGFLRAELDAAHEAADAAERAEITALFRRAVALERAFFDAAYQP
ncbi:TenA family protein [Elioraea sp.]|uniref:TenA family protein n=1 Tax=Elioraea sp. TaxID=2185103 RepID=UPI0021DEC3C2|nr:TenA family protein [Elioraea sp.]GIX11020.1 MAG: aminopyrimidine aminohydrolase [Elioraea sp.]